MTHELECNICHHKFQLNEDYSNGFCPECKIGYYYWDSCFYEDEDDSDEIGKEYNQGYYWSDEKW